jgi:hypothetical protein
LSSKLLKRLLTVKRYLELTVIRIHALALKGFGLGLESRFLR